MYRFHCHGVRMIIKYEFFFENDRAEVFELAFQPSDLSLEPLPIKTDESWTRLSSNQCSLCSLVSEEHTHCPVARNLSYVLSQFWEDVSYEKVTVRVTTDDRVIEKHTSLEEGVSPLMGLVMATSGCPILDKFKPMAFIHLPFSNETETIYRAVSMYLTAQYVRMKNNDKPDWDLHSFRDMYAQVNSVNNDFVKRLREIKGKDANVNALVLLDLFAQVGTFTFSDDWMKQIEPLFGAYLDE